MRKKTSTGTRGGGASVRQTLSIVETLMKKQQNRFVDRSCVVYVIVSICISQIFKINFRTHFQLPRFKIKCLFLQINLTALQILRSVKNDNFSEKNKRSSSLLFWKNGFNLHGFSWFTVIIITVGGKDSFRNSEYVDNKKLWFKGHVNLFNSQHLLRILKLQI